MSIIMTFDSKGARLDAVRKIVEDVLRKQYPDASIRFERKVAPESRSERFGEAQSQVSDAKSNAEEIRDELQNWMDNLPENLQSGTKADELQEAIDNLEEFITGCEQAEDVSVDFPSMM